MFTSTIGWSQGQCLTGGCTGGTNYPAGSFTNNTQTWSTVSTLIYAGEFAVYNVTSGSTYEWSLLSEDGKGTEKNVEFLVK